jgi:1-acyl-sn-glycerol-3-phosphate acyltransferase
MMEKAFDEVGKALDAGDLVGIFPEGKITGNGEINPFRPGITRILARNPVPWCRWRCAACGAASSRARTVRR